LFCPCFVNTFDISWFFDVGVICLHIKKNNIFKPASLTGKLKDPLESREYFICEHLWNVAIIAPGEGIRTKK